MTLSELVKVINATPLNEFDGNRIVSKGYTCDLLSWVMAKGEENMAWTTVMTHLNSVAVASLLEFSCIIIPEGISVPSDTIEKASEEDIAIFCTDISSYEISGLLYSHGLDNK